MSVICNERQVQKIVIGHIGGFAWPTIILFFLCIAIYAFCMYRLVFDHVFSMWVFFGVTFCAYVVYTPLHDAVHGAVTGMKPEHRWINEWVGFISAHVLGISFVSHRRTHLKHHRSTNHPEEDPDMVLAAKAPAQLIAIWFKALPKEWMFSASFQQFSKSELRLVQLELAAIVLTRLLLIILCADLSITLCTLLVGHVIGNAILVTLFAWSVHHPHSEQKRMKTTTIYQARGWLDIPLTLLWGFQNYHAIHHLFPKVPFFRYRILYQNLEGYLKAKDIPTRYLF